MIGFPLVTTPALDGLFHEADLEAGGGREFAANANEGTVLIEVVFENIAAEVQKDFIPKGEVGFLVGGERDAGAQHVADAVFHAPVVELALGVGLLDPALLEAQTVRPFEAEGLHLVGELLPDAMLVELLRDRQIAVGVRFDITVTGTDGERGAQGVVDARADEELLPFVTPVFAAVLHLQVQAPGAVEERVVADVVPPEVVVIRMLISSAHGARADRMDQKQKGEEEGLFHDQGQEVQRKNQANAAKDSHPFRRG